MTTHCVAVGSCISGGALMRLRSNGEATVHPDAGSTTQPVSAGRDLAPIVEAWRATQRFGHVAAHPRAWVRVEGLHRPWLQAALQAKAPDGSPFVGAIGAKAQARPLVPALDLPRLVEAFRPLVEAAGGTLHLLTCEAEADRQAIGAAGRDPERVACLVLLEHAGEQVPLLEVGAVGGDMPPTAVPGLWADVTGIGIVHVTTPEPYWPLVYAIATWLDRACGAYAAIRPAGATRWQSPRLQLPRALWTEAVRDGPFGQAVVAQAAELGLYEPPGRRLPTATHPPAETGSAAEMPSGIPGIAPGALSF